MASFLTAVQNNDNYQLLAMLIHRDNRLNINIQNENGLTPLMFGCMNGNLVIVQALLIAGADINLKNHRGESALIIAINSGFGDIMMELINHGADVNIVDNNGRNASYYYVTCGFVDIRTRIVAPFLQDQQIQIHYVD
jgi:ankyrin repeat protein